MIVYFLLILYSMSANSAKEGDDCIKDGSAGVCTNIRECAAAQIDISNRKKPQLCEFGGVEPTVCCVTPVTTTTARPNRGNCILPPYPDYGNYVTNVPNSRPGDAFDVVVLNVTCRRGYEADGMKTVFCHNGWWPEPVPNCVPACRLESHPTVEYSCIISDGRVNGTRACREYEPQGTVVSPRCKEPDFYSPSALSFMKCVDGLWDYVARCKPECGQMTTEDTELVIGKPKRREVPWAAGIYTKTMQPYVQLCGGTLISNKIIISAAHCFWSNTDGRKPASDYAVAVGKMYRTWQNEADAPWAQKSDIKEIHIPQRFQGHATNFQDDIAVLVASTPFEYKRNVGPACVDFDIVFERRQLQPGEKGMIAGWGLTGEDGKASPVLKVLEAPYVNINTCIQETPPGFREYITSDKMCAGAKDGSIALCRGDSGGGLAFPESVRGVKRYYLRGVMSVTPTNEHKCNTMAYTTFTQISRQENFIKQFYTDV